MIEKKTNKFIKGVSDEVKTLNGIISLNREIQESQNEENKKMMFSEVESSKILLGKQQNEANDALSQLSLAKSLKDSSGNAQIKKEKEDLSEDQGEYDIFAEKEISLPFTKRDLSPLEKLSFKRINKKESVTKKGSEDIPSKYVNIAVRNFYPLSRKLIYHGMFNSLKRDLVKANMKFIPENYISVLFFTTMLSLFVSIFLFVFFLFFNVGSAFPIISLAGEAIRDRALKFFGIIILIPLLTFFGIYTYPSLEKKSIENKINQELPFVTIHMSSISGAMKDPTKMFGIIIATGDYPNVQKEFSKIINEINLYGYDLVSALRGSAFNCPSNKLAELYNGISTTVSSGGNLSQFFEKRSETLLFDYKIEREKYNKSTETFMNIYLSVIIAAPMILMLLLIIMRISGLGVALSTSMISLITILGVTVANIFFLTFLYLKQPAQ
jgi:hypothetical protein